LNLKRVRNQAQHALPTPGSRATIARETVIGRQGLSALAGRISPWGFAVTAAVVWVAALPAAATADTVVLTDGIVLKGTVEEIDEDKLVIATDVLDDVEVDLEDVVSLHTTRPVRVRKWDGETVSGYAVLKDGRLSVHEAALPEPGAPMVEESAAPAGAVFAEPEEPVAAPMAEPANADADRPPVEPTVIELDDVESVEGYDSYYRYQGELNAGINVTTGNTRIKSYSANGYVEPSFGFNTITLSGQVNNQRSDGEQVAANWRTLAEYQREISPRWFVGALNSYDNDDLQGLHLRVTAGAGLGYKFFIRDPTHLSVLGAPVYVNENYRFTDDDRSFAAFRWALGFTQDIFTSDVSFYHNHTLTVGGASGRAQLIALTVTGLEFDLISDLDLKLEYQFDYNNRPATDAQTTDQRFIMTLGWDFEGDETDWWQ